MILGSFAAPSRNAGGFAGDETIRCDGLAVVADWITGLASRSVSEVFDVAPWDGSLTEVVAYSALYHEQAFPGFRPPCSHLSRQACWSEPVCDSSSLPLSLLAPGAMRPSGLVILLQQQYGRISVRIREERFPPLHLLGLLAEQGIGAGEFLPVFAGMLNSGLQYQDATDALAGLLL